eukprot:79374-Rhodomonas_salina.1
MPKRRPSVSAYATATTHTAYLSTRLLRYARTHIAYLPMRLLRKARCSHSVSAYATATKSPVLRRRRRR